MWSMRAEWESKRSHRSWMGTLTFAPEQRWLITMAAEIAHGGNLDALPLREKYLLLQREAGKAVTTYIKGLRKAGHALR